MAQKPSSLPTWATDGGTTLEPSAGEKAAGWVVGTRAPARWMNWVLNLIYQWTQYLDAPVGTGAGAGIDATGGSTSGSGLKGTGGAPNGKGLEGVGTGSGAGVTGTGGTTGAGVTGTGGATSGAGVTGTATAGNSDGVQGNGQGSGDGVQGTGGATGAGVRGIGGATSGAGVFGTGTAGNAKGGDFTAHGSGTGVSGTGGSSNGTGVVGTGGATNGIGVQGNGTGGGEGVIGTANSGTGVLGTSTSGSGVYGLSSSSYGVVAEGDTTSPAKAALRVVPQNADPSSSPAAGDFSVSGGTGKISMHDGNVWGRYVPVVFASGTPQSRTTTGIFNNFTFTVPANSLRVGSVIRVRAHGYVSSYGSGTIRLTSSLEGLELADSGAQTPVSGSRFIIECEAVVTAIGGAGVASAKANGFVLLGAGTVGAAASTYQHQHTSPPALNTTASMALAISVTISATATVELTQATYSIH